MASLEGPTSLHRHNVRNLPTDEKQAKQQLFVNFTDLSAIYKIKYSKIVKLNSEIAIPLENNNNRFTIPAWSIKAELELQTGIPSHLINLYKISGNLNKFESTFTGELIEDNQNLFKFLQHSSLINARLSPQWKGLISEVYDKNNDSTDLLDFYLQGAYKNFLNDRSERKNSGNEIGETIVSERHPKVPMSMVIGTILLIAARQQKNRILKFILMTETKILMASYGFHIIESLKFKTIFNRNIFHLLAMAGNKTNLNLVLNQYFHEEKSAGHQSQSGLLHKVPLKNYQKLLGHLINDCDYNKKSPMDCAVLNKNFELARIFWLESWELSNMTIDRFIKSGRDILEYSEMVKLYEEHQVGEYFEDAIMSYFSELKQRIESQNDKLQICHASMS